MRHEELTIFIVDDDESVLRSAKRLLNASGFAKIATFTSAEDFLHGAVLQRPCLLILDLVLPQMSGIALHRHLRKAGFAIDTVLISALEPELDKARTECPEAIAYLQKPFEKGNLMAAVSRASEANH